MTNIWFESVVTLVAFLAAVVLVLCIAAMLHWGRNRDHGLIPYIFYPAILALMLAVLFSGRNLNLPFDYPLDKHPIVAWTTRFAALFILLAAVERIGRRFLHYGRKPEAPVLLILAFWLFFLTNVVTSGLFGARPGLSHYHFYMALTGYAALLVAREDGHTAIRTVRNAFFIFLVLSALCILWKPELVLSHYYVAGVIPGLTVRYAGLGTHYNSLGPIVIVFLLSLWTDPYRARWLNWLGWALGLASLVLSQSKTSWVAFVLCACCIAYYRHRGFLVQRFFDFRRPLLPATSLMLAMFAVSLIGVALMLGGVEHVAAFLETPKGEDLTSLMGRDRIWEAAVQEWRSNPLFGYGLTMWNEDYRARIGMSEFAYSAHNQFFQSLAIAGIVGVTGLVIYAVTLLWFVLKTAKPSQGLTLALFALLSVQSITEVALSMTSGYGLPQQVHLFLLMVLASRYTASTVASPAAGASVRRRLATP